MTFEYLFFLTFVLFRKLVNVHLTTEKKNPPLTGIFAARLTNASSLVREASKSGEERSFNQQGDDQPFLRIEIKLFADAPNTPSNPAYSAEEMGDLETNIVPLTEEILHPVGD